MPARIKVTCVLALTMSFYWVVQAQWTNRYPKIAGFSHHVYLEGYEMPTLGAGPTDPAASPDNAVLAVASRGWLWLLDLKTGEARRLTRGAGDRAARARREPLHAARWTPLRRT